jgi:multiple sugar transport system permease protein
MLRSKRSEILAACMLMAPFVVTYGVLFVYPTIKMAQLSLTNAPLIGPGKWVGFDNYFRLASDRLFSVAIWNTLYFVILSVIPSTLIGLLVALGVNRLKGWLQSVVLAAFFLPYILPVSVVFRIWQWMCDKDFGIAQHVVQLFNDGQRLSIFRTIPLFMPAVAVVTIWWLIGFNVLLFIAGLRNISSEIWPVTVLVFTIQLVLQLKIFDQVYLFAQGGRIDTTIVMVQYILKQAFQMNKGGLAAAASMVLFVLIAALSVLQFQLLRARGDR